MRLVTARGRAKAELKWRTIGAAPRRRWGREVRIKGYWRHL